LTSVSVPVSSQLPDAGHDTARPVDGASKKMSGPGRCQVPDTSATRNACGVPPRVVYSPVAVQFPGDWQDTELSSANWPVLSCEKLPKVWKKPQVPFTSSSTNGCFALDASRNEPTTVQLPTEGHDTDSACESELSRPGMSIACCQVPLRSTATVARSLNWSVEVSPAATQ
jgi:hypothetical protein